MKAPKDARVPLRAVVRVEEFLGPRGGRYFLLYLLCSHFMVGRAPATEVRCIACFAQRQLAAPAPTNKEP